MMRGLSLSLAFSLALIGGALGQARPPSQKTGPITIYGEGSSGPAGGFSVTPRADAALGTLARTLYSPAFPGMVQAPVFRSTATPSFTQFYSGQNTTSNLAIDVTAAAESVSEQVGVFRMTSNKGVSGGVPAYKMALGAEADCGPGSAPCWGMTTVGTYNQGYPSTNYQVVHEFDQNNNSGYNCPDADYGTINTIPCGTIYVTGAGANQITFGIGIAGYSKIRNGIQFDSSGPQAASLRDYSNSQVIYKDSGHHVTGIDLRDGTFAAAPFISTGFQVDKIGAITGSRIQLTPQTFAALTAAAPCGVGQMGTIAFVRDSSQPQTAPGSVVAGGGTNAVSVVCNGGVYVVH